MSDTPRTDEDLRKIWRDAGGSFHGPHVETGTMPEAKLLPFLRVLVAAESKVDALTKERDEALEGKKIMRKGGVIYQARALSAEDDVKQLEVKVDALMREIKERDDHDDVLVFHLDRLREALHLANEHMKLYLPHYGPGHNIYEAAVRALVREQQNTTQEQHDVD